MFMVLWHVCYDQSFLSKIKYWLHISHVISEKNYAKSLGMLFSFVKMRCHENSFGELTRCSETPRAEHFPGICPMSSGALLNGGLIHINDHIILWPCPTSHRVLYSYPALTAGNLSRVMLSSPQHPSMYYGYTPVLLQPSQLSGWLPIYIRVALLNLGQRNDYLSTSEANHDLLPIELLRTNTLQWKLCHSEEWPFHL